MDKSLILNLVFDGACYADDIKLLEEGEYQKNFDELHKIYEKLTKDLPEEEEKKINWDFYLALGGIEAAVRDLYFKEGFKLGLKIGAQNFLD